MAGAAGTEAEPSGECMKCRHELVCRDPEPLRRDGGVGGVRVVSHQRSRYRLVIGELQRWHYPSHHRWHARLATREARSGTPPTRSRSAELLNDLGGLVGWTRLLLAPSKSLHGVPRVEVTITSGTAILGPEWNPHPSISSSTSCAAC